MANKRNTPAVDLALIAVFAALIAVLSVVPGVPMPTGVPITLQTLGVLLAGLVLGPWRGFLSVLLYLLVGFAGLPIFANFTGGLSVFTNMSIGYLLAFPMAAFVAGLLAIGVVRIGLKGRYIWLTLSAAFGTYLFISTGGIIGMMVIGQTDFWTAFGYNVPFIIGDGIKSFAAAAIAVAVNKAFPALLASRKPVTA